MRITSSAGCLAVLISGATLLAQTPSTPSLSRTALASKIDQFVPHAMAELNVVPGLSVAVVRRNETIYAKGFGVADVTAHTPVKADTVFYTASLAKAVTGMTVATLVADGQLSLDTPLTTLFPGLVLPAGTDANKATLKGLLGHDPGFGNSTVNYVTTFVRQYKPAELIHVLNTYSQPLPKFIYANSNYALAGEIIRSTTGRDWRDVIADRVFTPLGMSRSTFYGSKAIAGAKPYRADADGFTPIRLPKTDGNTTGAGGFYSTAPDVAQLVKAYLNAGRVNGRQALPAAAVALTQQPNSVMSGTFAYFDRTGYGIGLYQGSYDGEALVHHFGGIAGYRSHMSFMPQHNIGVVVLENEGGDGSRFADLVAAYAYDLLLGKDADARAATRISEYRASIDKSRADSPVWIAQLKTFNLAPAAMPMNLAAYAGTYSNDRLGTLTVSVESGALRVVLGELHGTAVRIGGHNVLVDYGGGDAPDAWTFTVRAGQVEGIDWGGRIFFKMPSGRTP